ncbi:DUF3592 domain-containing protein [Streptomyces mobaraensis]|uniref:DUF3592 domain-containing protein n=1 Tax=Streptomyces mobaraensis TaxID=35621 RepID=UPI00331A31B7
MTHRTLEFLVVLLSAVFFLTLVAHVRNQILRNRGVRTTGVCVNHSASSRDGRTGILIEFSTGEGRRIRFNAGYHEFPPVQVGGAVDIVYDRKNPDRADFAWETAPSGLKARIFLICLALVIGILVALRVSIA